MVEREGERALGAGARQEHGRRPKSHGGKCHDRQRRPGGAPAHFGQHRQGRQRDQRGGGPNRAVDQGQLAGGVQLSIVEERGAWAQVMGSNGWTGWVDGRLLAKLG